MPKLLDRNRQIPGGLKFMLPEIKWSTTPWASFSTMVDESYNVGRANPYKAKQNGWPTTKEGWADRIDAYNSAICVAHGWNNYITEGGDNPKSKRPWLQSVNHAAAGAKTISEMFGAEGPIRDRELATKRAAVCVECPVMDKGDWTRFFTVPAADLLRSVLGVVKDLDLTTEHDSKLGVCTACDCPMRLKVWGRLSHINKHIPADAREKLDPRCWILLESKESQS